jgi:pSer/pThr/pTyr-binding forkhead associated (FHA) protein
MGLRLEVGTATNEPAHAVYEFDQARVVFGRASGADVRLPHAAVSHTHASVRVQASAYVVVDESSTNGTRVNGQRIAPGRPKTIRDGDVVLVGPFRIVVRTAVPVGEGASAERTTELARRLARLALGDVRALGAPRLVVLHGPDAGREIDLGAVPLAVRVGRGETCELTLSDADVSREHVELVHDADGVLVRDLESKNGLFVHERRIQEKRLHHGDEVRIGGTVLRFEEPADEAIERLQAEPDLALPEPPASIAGPEAAPIPTSTPPAPAPVTIDRDAEVEARPRPRSPTPRAPITDAMVYLLAGAILALSIAGLVYLVGAG